MRLDELHRSAEITSAEPRDFDWDAMLDAAAGPGAGTNLCPPGMSSEECIASLSDKVRRLRMSVQVERATWRAEYRKSDRLRAQVKEMRAALGY